MFYKDSGLYYSYEVCGAPDLFTRPCLCETYDGQYLPGQKPDFSFVDRIKYKEWGADDSINVARSFCENSDAMVTTPFNSFVAFHTARYFRAAPKCFVNPDTCFLPDVQQNGSVFITRQTGRWIGLPPGRAVSAINCGSVRGNVLFDKPVDYGNGILAPGRTHPTLGLTAFYGIADHDEHMMMAYFREMQDTGPNRVFPSWAVAATHATRTFTATDDKCEYKCTITPTCAGFMHRDTTCHFFDTLSGDWIENWSETDAALGRSLRGYPYYRLPGSPIPRTGGGFGTQLRRFFARNPSIRSSMIEAIAETNTPTATRSNVWVQFIEQLRLDKVNEERIVLRDEMALIMVKLIGIMNLATDTSSGVATMRAVVPSIYISFTPYWRKCTVSDKNEMKDTCPKVRANDYQDGYVSDEAEDAKGYLSQNAWTYANCIVTERSIIGSNGTHIFLAVAQTQNGNDDINMDQVDDKNEMCTSAYFPGKVRCGFLKVALRLLLQTVTMEPYPYVNGDLCRVLLAGHSCLQPEQMKLVVGGMTMGASVLTIYLMILKKMLHDQYAITIDASNVITRLWLPMWAGDSTFAAAFTDAFGASTLAMSHLVDPFVMGASFFDIFVPDKAHPNVQSIITSSVGACEGKWRDCAPTCLRNPLDPICMLETLSIPIPGGPSGHASLPIMLGDDDWKIPDNNVLLVTADLLDGVVNSITGRGTQSNTCIMRQALYGYLYSNICAGQEDDEEFLEDLNRQNWLNYRLWHGTGVGIWHMTQRYTVRARVADGTLPASALDDFDSLFCMTPGDETPQDLLVRFTFPGNPGFIGPGAYDELRSVWP